MTRFALFFSLFLLALPARADNVYSEATFVNLAHTLVRFNAIDLGEDAIVDDYAMITDCALYRSFFRDDFKWNDVRKAIRESVRINIATFPIAYYNDTVVQLDRYDFKHKEFRFRDSATIKGANVFLLYNTPGYECANKDLVYIPGIYRGYLDQSVTIEGVPLAQDDAEALLHRLDGSGNARHALFVRFHLRVVNVDPLRLINKFDGKLHFSQDSSGSANQIRMDLRLDSVNFYEDEDMTRLLYSYRP